MKQPDRILKSGTKIVTHEKLDDTEGMMIHQRHIDARRPNLPGMVDGVVGGHGGDVYWVRHEGSPEAAAYCFTEFELA